MMKDDIFYLTKLCGLTGEEDEVSRGLSILLEPLVDEMKIDEMGNLIGIRRCADPYAERLLLTAHMDQVGMVITDIVDEGFACVAGLNGRTDSGAISICSGGAMTFGVSVPTRYGHSQVSNVYWPDVEQAVRMARLFIERTEDME